MIWGGLEKGRKKKGRQRSPSHVSPAGREKRTYTTLNAFLRLTPGGGGRPKPACEGGFQISCGVRKLVTVRKGNRLQLAHTKIGVRKGWKKKRTALSRVGQNPAVPPRLGDDATDYNSLRHFMPRRGIPLRKNVQRGCAIFAQTGAKNGASRRALGAGRRLSGEERRGQGGRSRGPTGKRR